MKRNCEDCRIWTENIPCSEFAKRHQLYSEGGRNFTQEFDAGKCICFHEFGTILIWNEIDV